MSSPTRRESANAADPPRGMHAGEKIALAAILIPLILSMVGVYGQALLTKAAVDRHETKLQKIDELNERTIRMESKLDTIVNRTGGRAGRE